jgi:pilus assembly protein CpaC
MVEIEVEIIEVNENKIKDFGSELPSIFSVEESNIPSIIESGAFRRTTKFTATLKALEENGIAKILSKPKLVTKSGTRASFMVGGEIPVATGTRVKKFHTKWKKYGIIMEITPTIIKHDKIDIVIDTELSRIDRSVLGADKCPGISKRHAFSNLQIKNGETVVLAGLIETTKETIVKGVPFLKSIPILGILFRHKCDVEKKTNILIFVTTKLLLV